MYTRPGILCAPPYYRNRRWLRVVSEWPAAVGVLSGAWDLRKYGGAREEKYVPLEALERMLLVYFSQLE